MQRNLALMAILWLSGSHVVAAQRAVVVPDQSTAIAIAKAVLVPVYGEDFAQNRKRQPSAGAHHFYATLHADTWVVEDAPPSRLKWSEPILRVEIDRTRGCIKNMDEFE